MDLSFGSEYDSFRDDVKTFLKDNQDKAPKGAGRAEDAEAAKQLLDWQKLLIENGYTCRTIPKEYGGSMQFLPSYKSQAISISRQPCHLQVLQSEFQRYISILLVPQLLSYLRRCF